MSKIDGDHSPHFSIPGPDQKGFSCKGTLVANCCKYVFVCLTQNLPWVYTVQMDAEDLGRKLLLNCWKLLKTSQNCWQVLLRCVLSVSTSCFPIMAKSNVWKQSWLVATSNCPAEKTYRMSYWPPAVCPSKRLCPYARCKCYPRPKW